MEEIWKDIVGYEGYYAVSNLGSVKTFDREIRYKYKSKIRVDFLKSRILKPQKHRNSYLSVTLYNADRKSKQFNIHRLVAEAFVDNPHSKKEVNHINGIKTDNRAENLEWVTRSENAKHYISLGLFKPKFGESNHSSVLTQKQADEIRKEYAKGGISQSELSKKFKVCQSTISVIVQNKRYNKI